MNGRILQEIIKIKRSYRNVVTISQKKFRFGNVIWQLTRIYEISVITLLSVENVKSQTECQSS